MGLKVRLNHKGLPFPIMSQCVGASLQDCMQKRRSWVREISQVVLWNWKFLKGSILAPSLEEPLSLFHPLHPFQTLCALQSNVQQECLSPLLCQRPGRCLWWKKAGLSLVAQELCFSLDLYKTMKWLVLTHFVSHRTPLSEAGVLWGSSCVQQENKVAWLL